MATWDELIATIAGQYARAIAPSGAVSWTSSRPRRASEPRGAASRWLASIPTRRPSTSRHVYDEAMREALIVIWGAPTASAATGRLPTCRPLPAPARRTPQRVRWAPAKAEQFVNFPD